MDGTPAGYTYKLKVSNGSLSITGSVATLTFEVVDAAIVRSDEAEIITGNWEWQDGIHLSFGNDDDASWAWDSADARLELRNVSDVPIFWFDPANYSFGVAAVTDPESGLYSSDAAGADREDEYAGGIGASFTDGTEDAEVSNWLAYYMKAGTKTAGITIVGADNEVNLGDHDLITSGEIVGRNRWGANVASTPVNHNTTDLHGLMYLITVAATVNLDAAADAGYGACVNYRIRDAAEAVIIDLDGSEYMNLAGTALAQGVGVTATGAGEYLTVCATTDADGSGGDGYFIYGETAGWASQ